MRNITLKDVARKAGVSYATVSRALSGNPHIRPDTRKRVLEICSEMGYTANYIARSMVMNKTDLIGLVVPTIDNQFMSEIAYYTEMSARTRGYNIMLCNSEPGPEQELTAVKLLTGRKVDGILIVPQNHNTYKNIKQYTEMVPVVFLGENLGNEPMSYVTVDNEYGTKIGMQYLTGLGHRDILYFGRRKNTTHLLRAEGYIRECTRLGLRQIFFDSPYGRSSIEYGYRMAKDLFSRPVDYTAIFASTDSNAIGIMKAAEESGIDIPGKISLLGFDDTGSASLPKIELTTIRQPKKEMAVQAVDILLNKINDRTEAYTHQILRPDLIERKTCRKL
jgi:LacI family transcriptional regulator